MRLVIPCIHHITLYSEKLLLLKEDIISVHKHHPNTFPLNGISKNHWSLQTYFLAMIFNHLHITLIGNKEARGQQSSKHTYPYHWSHTYPHIIPIPAQWAKIPHGFCLWLPSNRSVTVFQWAESNQETLCGTQMLPAPTLCGNYTTIPTQSNRGVTWSTNRVPCFCHHPIRNSTSSQTISHMVLCNLCYDLQVCQDLQSPMGSSIYRDHGRSKWIQRIRQKNDPSTTSTISTTRCREHCGSFTGWDIPGGISRQLQSYWISPTRTRWCIQFLSRPHLIFPYDLNWLFSVPCEWAPMMSSLK